MLALAITLAGVTIVLTPPLASACNENNPGGYTYEPCDYQTDYCGGYDQCPAPDCQENSDYCCPSSMPVQPTLPILKPIDALVGRAILAIRQALPTT